MIIESVVTQDWCSIAFGTFEQLEIRDRSVLHHRHIASADQLSQGGRIIYRARESRIRQDHRRGPPADQHIAHGDQICGTGLPPVRLTVLVAILGVRDIRTVYIREPACNQGQIQEFMPGAQPGPLILMRRRVSRLDSGVDDLDRRSLRSSICPVYSPTGPRVTKRWRG